MSFPMRGVSIGVKYLSKLHFFGILNNIPTFDLSQRIRRVLRIVGMGKRAETLFKDLSQGMKQRLAIARAFLTAPKILFMDEPTLNLDPNAAYSLMDFISKEIVRQEGKTVFLATHNLKEFEDSGDRISIMHEGKIRACGAKDELGKDSLYEIYSRYTGEAPDAFMA